MVNKQESKYLRFVSIMTLAVIAFLCLVSMACGAPTTLPQVVKSVDIPQHIGNTYAETHISGQEMTVAADMLNIRVSPGGEVVHFTYLIRGDRVTVYERQPDQYGYQWCRTGLHWVGCEWLDEVK